MTTYKEGGAECFNSLIQTKRKLTKSSLHEQKTYDLNIVNWFHYIIWWRKWQILHIFFILLQINLQQFWDIYKMLKQNVYQNKLNIQFHTNVREIKWFIRSNLFCGWKDLTDALGFPSVACKDTTLLNLRHYIWMQ